MSNKAIQALFEKKLRAIDPAFPTAWENKSFSPVVNSAYQRVNMLMNAPSDITINVDIIEKMGIFQVTLCYPAGVGRGAIQDHAEQLQQEFEVQALNDGALDVEITSTPSIGSPFNDEDRYCVAVSIPWSSYLYK